MPIDPDHFPGSGRAGGYTVRANEFYGYWVRNSAKGLQAGFIQLDKPWRPIIRLPITF
jgi:hypothetical protein